MREESNVSQEQGERVSDNEYEAIKEEAVETFANKLLAASWGEHDILPRKIWFWWD